MTNLPVRCRLPVFALFTGGMSSSVSWPSSAAACKYLTCDTISEIEWWTADSNISVTCLDPACECWTSGRERVATWPCAPLRLLRLFMTGMLASSKKTVNYKPYIRLLQTILKFLTWKFTVSVRNGSVFHGVKLGKIRFTICLPGLLSSHLF